MPLRCVLKSRQSSGVAVGRPPRRSGWSRRQCSPGCRCPTWPGERASLPACCSPGVDECWKAACNRSRLTESASERAVSVSWNDGCASWSACSAARPWKSRFSQGSARRRAGKKPELAAVNMERSKGRFAMKAVADTLAVARSNLIERVSRRAKSRRPYRKAGDDELLALIRRLVDERPTYGYRRIRRLINRQRKANGKPLVNGKRVLRIMQANKLTLERHSGRRPGRTHDGVVIALRSNIRWCSDHFELACRNGEIVRVLFAIDACDREVMGWLAASAGISGEMVRDLMIACVERRFGISKAAHPVEWLSDNGSAYIAKDTLDTATALGLKLCFTPVRSPESNGIAEAFVKTFKRDYARLSILPDAKTVIALLPAWFEDYNEVHPHSGLKFLFPREFLRLSA